MFGASAFSEVSFSETESAESAILVSSRPVIYFNSSTLTFPLNINTATHFPLSMNTIHDYSLAMNRIIDFDSRR